MRYTIIALILAVVVIAAGCSTPTPITQMDRNVQASSLSASPSLAFQLAAFLVKGGNPKYAVVPLNTPLYKLGYTNAEVLRIMIGASTVNAVGPTMEVDVPEWDEWLTSTVFGEKIAKSGYIPSKLMEVDVPEWDEWLTSFSGMQQYRSSDWQAWAVYGPGSILEVDVPEWDEWLTSFTLGNLANSYAAWCAGGARTASM